MPQTSSPATHQEHLKTPQSTVMAILQAKAANDLQRQRNEQQDCDTCGHHTPSLGWFWETHPWITRREPTPAQQEKEQDRHKEPDRTAQQKEITSLQEALTAAGHREQLEKATRQVLERELFQTKAEVQTLTQQFGNIKEELDMVQRELKQSYRLCMVSSKRHPAARHTASSANPCAPAHRYKGGSQSLLLDTSQISFQETSAAAEGTELIQMNSEVTHEVTLKELNRMARNIPAFTPELAGDHDVHAYILYLLWITSCPEVRCFLARRPVHIHSDYQQLRQAIIKELSDPESEHGLIAALATKQGRYETPYAYFHRRRQAYFGAHNEPGMEEDTSFKSLFLQNLHPLVSHHLGILACPHSMPIQQLCDLTQKAFKKHKASTKGVCKNPLILNCTTQNSKQASEGSQHCHNARPFYRKTLANRGHNRRHGNRPRFQTNHWEEPWKRASSACEHHGMSKSSQPHHPPPHPSHRSILRNQQRWIEQRAPHAQQRNLYQHNSGKLNNTVNIRLLVTFKQNRGLTTTCCPPAIITSSTGCSKQQIPWIAYRLTTPKATI
ncbi:hypothetical protein M9458_056804 [Cirrhinus mrigala]|uniref:Uncharacterized protein n=1 Tax=Cirrhinus mrigala TaxID=683832 RepID=A0ABD0MFQ5_CIRMR